jgi:hypothetical protein
LAEYLQSSPYDLPLSFLTSFNNKRARQQLFTDDKII